MHDGAAFVVLCSERFLREQGRKAECRFRFGTAIGDDPMMSPKSAVSAAKAILAKRGILIRRSMLLRSMKRLPLLMFYLNVHFRGLKTVIISGAGHLPMGIHMESPAQ